mmetsp:Transcript_132986/g.384589  ORF Transcript_132986/g.384589 Transcript_132986/m.384589 type:complete len:223 (+) Transcript_132986:883-1551(+)
MERASRPARCDLRPPRARPPLLRAPLRQQPSAAPQASPAHCRTPSRGRLATGKPSTPTRRRCRSAAGRGRRWRLPARGPRACAPRRHACCRRAGAASSCAAASPSAGTGGKNGNLLRSCTPWCGKRRRACNGPCSATGRRWTAPPPSSRPRRRPSPTQRRIEARLVGVSRPRSPHEDLPRRPPPDCSRPRGPPRRASTSARTPSPPSDPPNASPMRRTPTPP